MNAKHETKHVIASRSSRTFAAIALVALMLSVNLSAIAQNAAPEKTMQPAVGAPAPGGVLTPEALKAYLARSTEPTQPAGTKGTHEGFVVHGHWVIDVRNPDGTLAQHREFENSLESTAQGTMAGLLGGEFSMGSMMITMGYSGTGPCQGSVSFPGWCAVVVNLSTQPATSYCGAYVCAPTMTETFNAGTNYGGPFNLVLTGNITANSAGTINSVYTIFATCANIAYNSGTTTTPSTASTTTNANCVSGGGSPVPNYWVGPLTAASITGVPVSSGQIIQVTVTLTFS
jgi:hypothetical protein